MKLYRLPSHGLAATEQVSYANYGQYGHKMLVQICATRYK
jgi:hypothetical protein